jgi:PAS domain S-box-containing protein
MERTGGVQRTNAAHSSERDLAAIINTIPTAAWTTRPDGYCDFLNRVWLDYAGMTAEQAQGWGWAEAIHADDRKRLVEEWQSCLASGTPVDTEARIRRFDSSYRWFLIRGNPLKDQGGNILKWYGTCVDIEDRKRGEESLRARELSWRQIVDNVPGLVATTGALGEVEFLNRQTLEYFGKTSEELKNWALIGAVHPDDLPRVIEARKKSIEAGQIYDVEHRCRRADGVYRWFQVRGLPARTVEGTITAWYLLLTDIDDRKKAEEALQSSERNLSLMISAIPTYIHVLSTDGSVLNVNQAVLDYTGLSLEDVRKENYRARIFHPEDVERLREDRREALTRAVPFDNEQRVLGKDGKYRWFLIRYNPLLDEQGRIDRWYVAATDIEDRKRAEKALRESEERARLIVDSIDALVMTATPEGEVEFVNQQVLDYFGKSLEELKGWATSDVIHRDDLPKALALWAHSVETGDPYQSEQRLRRADGAYRWFRVSGRSLRDAQGYVLRWYVLLTDIDERKRAEARVEQAYLRLAEAQRLSKTGSFITDLLVDDHDWSEEAFRIFEFDPAAKVTVQNIRHRVHPEDLPFFDSVIARGMQGMDVDFVFRIVTSGGAVKHVRGMARVIEQIAGRPLFIGALQDVTESKVAEEALNGARSELAHVTRVTTLNALTASIAHEVNQPLSGIVSNAGATLRFLSGDAPNLEEAREAVHDIVRDGKRASEIITGIRALTKRTATRREKLDLNETISEVLAIIGYEAKRHSVIVRTQFADTLSPVSGDRVQLQQVVLNLVMNAIEAMSNVSERPRELVITTQILDPDCVQATVEDSGTGIAADTVDKIFDSFYTTKSGGMGMGLSISRSILQSHGGRLWAVAKDAPGTMFHFTVPKYHEEGVHAPATGT